jgi:hypothetical protein
MQKKVDEFVSTYGKEHDARVMLLVTNNAYGTIEAPPPFKIVRIPNAEGTICIKKEPPLVRSEGV